MTRKMRIHLNILTYIAFTNMVGVFADYVAPFLGM